MVRAILLAALTAVTPSVPGPATPAATPPPRATVASPWSWPLAPRPAVVRPFRAPPTPWGAGHRGVDLAGSIGRQVLSAGRGQVAFSGVVAGRGVVVVTHPGGLRTSYEPVNERVDVGTAVVAGSVLGVLSAGYSHCAPGTCLHWGLRRGTVYVDPLTLVGRGPPVLLTLD